MAQKRKLWLAIAIGLAGLNAAGGMFALAMGQARHALAHGVLLIGFAMWARYLRRQRPPAAPEPDARVELLEANLSELEQQLTETRERLEFADQLLRQRKKPE